jgi:hypothetical protein
LRALLGQLNHQPLKLLLLLLLLLLRLLWRLGLQAH